MENEEKDGLLPDEETQRKDAIYEAAKKWLPTENAVKLNSFPYEEGLAAMESIRGWRDSEELIEKAKVAIDRIKEREAKEEEERKAYALKKKKKKKTLIFLSLSLIALAGLYLFALRPHVQYFRARYLMRQERYGEAYKLLNRLTDEKSTAALKELIPLYKKQLMDQAEIGSLIILGSYEQDNMSYNGKELLEWRVLDKQDGKMLLITRYGIDCLPFDWKESKSTWDKCMLRKWLNSDFLEEAFSEEDKTMIIETPVTAEPNPEFNTRSGEDTVDKVFLLSISEAEKYFSSTQDRRCQLTPYSRALGAYLSDDGGCWYWLRTSGASREAAAIVIAAGFVSTRGVRVMFERTTVRPAVWISLTE